MDQDPELTKIKEILADIEKTYDCVPLVSGILLEHPEHFIPSSALCLRKKPVFNTKTCCLIVLAAQGAKHCIRAQMADAVRFGTTEDEVFEIASYMCMTCPQSYSFRVFPEEFGKDAEKAENSIKDSLNLYIASGMGHAW